MNAEADTLIHNTRRDFLKLGVLAGGGLVLGIGFFLLQKVLESGTVVFRADPVLLAWVPTALMATAAILLISRTR